MPTRRTPDGEKGFLGIRWILGRIILGAGINALPEFLSRRSERAGKVRKLLRSKEEDDDQQYENEFAWTQSKHDCLPSGAIIPPGVDLSAVTVS